MTKDFCSWCERGEKPKELDQDGVLTSITGKPGYLCHAQDDFWWPCVPSITQEATSNLIRDLAECKAEKESLNRVLSAANNSLAYEQNDCQKLRSQLAGMKEVVEAARTFLAKIIACEQEINICVMMSRTHGAPYTGPNWQDERDGLAKALLTLK